MDTQALFTIYQEQLEKLPTDVFIGDVLTFEFRQPKVTHADLKAWFDELGLDESYLPPPIKAVDAYRRATGPDFAKRSYDLPGGRTAELFTRDVSKDDDRIIRYIIREVRDPKGKKLTYDEVGSAVFYKASRTAKRKGLGGESVKFTIVERNCSANDLPEVQAFVRKMQEDYKFFSLHYYTQAIRDLTRNYVVGLNSIGLRSSGGVYFVHKSRRETVLKLSELINNRVGAGCRIHLMPLVDSGYQREMLTEAFQDEVEDNCGKLLSKVAALNERYKGKKVPPAKYAEIQEAYADTLSRSEEYTRVLGLAQDRAAVALEMALDSIADVAMRLEVAS